VIFVRGGSLTEKHTHTLIALQLRDGAARIGICCNEVETEPSRVLQDVIPHPKVCFTTSDLLVGDDIELEHTQEHGEVTHWTAWFKVDAQEDEDEEAVCERLTTVVRSCFVGPVGKEEARERVTARDLRGLQPPRT
jgi:hypothetical protein